MSPEHSTRTKKSPLLELMALFAVIVYQLAAHGSFIALEKMVKPFLAPVFYFPADRILYGILFPLFGFLFFFHLIPGIFGRGNRAQWEVTHSRPVRMGIGLLTGLAAFAILTILDILSLMPDSPQNTDSIDSLFQNSTNPGITIGLLWISMGLITPFLEEIYYRWILPLFLVGRGFPILFAMIFQGLIFGLSHPPSAAIFLSVYGIALGWISGRWGLSASISSHMTYNISILIYSFLPLFFY